MVSPPEFVHSNPTEHVLQIDIIRESGWFNRFCLDSRDQETIYYCEVKESHLVFHRGGKAGPIIATTDVCVGTPGATDLEFKEPRAIFHIQHEHNNLHPDKTEFRYGGKTYHWLGHSELVEVETGKVIAQFRTSWHIMESIEHKLGTLTVKGDGMSMTDIVVITALIVQERSEEGRLAVPPVMMQLTQIAMRRRMSEAKETKQSKEHE